MINPKVTLPADKQPAIKLVTMPKDSNGGGSVFGGWIMANVDMAGSIPAVERARGRVATVAVNSFEFHEPVLVGDVVSYFAEVIRTGRSSITVKVEVYAERNPAEKQTIKVTEAELTYVALDENRVPRQLPDLETT